MGGTMSNRQLKRWLRNERGAIMSNKERSLQDIGCGAAECIADMVAALECDYDRLEELREPQWFTTSSGSIELKLTFAEAQSGAQSGACDDDDVRALSKLPHILKQLAEIDAAELSAELKEYGAWEMMQSARTTIRICSAFCGSRVAILATAAWPR